MRVPRNTLVTVTSDGRLVPGARVEGSVVWPFTQIWWLPWRSTDPGRLDPINVAVIGAAPRQVHDALLAQGWHRPADGGTHKIRVGHRFRRMSDHIALGDRAERTHARLFAVAGATLIGAHHEVLDQRGTHVVCSWNRARATAVAALERAGYVRLDDSDVVTPPDLRGVPSDGRAWRAVAPPPSSD